MYLVFWVVAVVILLIFVLFVSCPPSPISNSSPEFSASVSSLKNCHLGFSDGQKDRSCFHSLVTFEVCGKLCLFVYYRRRIIVMHQPLSVPHSKYQILQNRAKMCILKSWKWRSRKGWKELSRSRRRMKSYYTPIVHSLLWPAFTSL